MASAHVDMVTPPKNSDALTVQPACQLSWLWRSIGFFGLLLLASTWRLWTPQDVFPQVPLIQAAGQIPRWLEWSLLAAMIATLAFLLAGPESARKRAIMTFTVACALMIAIDQHRLQPWAYQLVILGMIGVLASPRLAVSLARWLLVSIYFFSAVSKFDYQFVHTLGQQFLETLLGFVNVSTSQWSEGARSIAATVFPVGELCIALGLMMPKTRRLAARMGIGLHGALLLILGPLGLNHYPGVLVWNLFFIAQLAILFLTSMPERLSRSSSHDTVADQFAKLLATCCILAPLTEPFGLIDHWPAWQLYAPRNSRVTMQIFESARDQLSAEILRHVAPADDGGPLLGVDLDRWSLESVSAPIYPQDRFQLGVAAAVARDNRLGGAVVVSRQSVADRLSGRRRQTILRGTERVEEELSKFRFNAVPR